MLDVARTMLSRGFSLVATRGTADYLTAHGVACERVNKVLEGRPHVVDLIKNGEISYIINTTEGKQAIVDSFSILGTADEHVEKLKQLEAAGVDQFAIYLMCGEEERNLKEYCDNILPHFVKNEALAG